jgi:lipoprotein NlpD
MFVAAGWMWLGSAGCHPDRGRPMHPDSPPGSWYVVEPGETLQQIAARVGVPVEDLMEINGLSRTSEVRAGRLIYVLGRTPGALGRATEGAPGSGLPPPSPYMADTRPLPPPPGQVGLPPASVRFAPGPGTFRWPLDAAAVGSPFGHREGRQHEGIDLPAPIGTPVHAAGDGQVIYAGDGIRGYGNLVVIEHAGDLLTVYAHNSELLVREGDRLVAGQRIALVGQSGRASGPHLHFEVRSGQIPQDPMTYLPLALPLPVPARSTGGAP